MMRPTMNEAAIAAHEMYLSLVSAGFNEDQALDIVTDVIISSGGASDEQA